MRDRDTSTGCLSLLEGNGMLSYGGNTQQWGMLQPRVSLLSGNGKKTLSRERKGKISSIFFVLNQDNFLLQFGGKLCVCERNSEGTNECWAWWQGQICGPIKDLICRVLHQAREHLPDPEVCVSGEQTRRAVASTGARHPAARLMFDPGSCWWERGHPTAPAHQHSLRGHLEEPRPRETPSSCSTAASVLFLVDAGRASWEGITKHLSSGASQGTPQTLSH